MTPTILISGCDESRALYENAVLQCGGEIASFYCPPLDDSFDALLLCGGNDVSPYFYHQENTACVNLDEKRDKIELALIQMYREAGKPILGICRGMQILNVALGGSLQQDIGEEMHIFHTPGKETMDKTHPIRTREGSLMYKTYGPRLTVNSLHHQAVDRLADGLLATAWSESGLIETVEHKSLPILGVQWHPERMSFERRRADTADGAFLFKWLISAASNGRQEVL